MPKSPYIRIDKQRTQRIATAEQLLLADVRNLAQHLLYLERELGSLSNARKALKLVSDEIQKSIYTDMETQRRLLKQQIKMHRDSVTTRG